MKPIRHLLVIRLSAMGDVAMCVPVLQRLISTQPDLKITVLTKAFFKPILETLPGVQVVVADVKGKHKGVPGLWKLARELKSRDIDAIADFHNVLRSKILRFFLAHLPSAAIDKGRKAKKELTRPKDKKFHQLKTTHQRYADVLADLGSPINWDKPKQLKPQDLPESLQQELSFEKNWIGVAPFAAHRAKMYPLDLMRDILAKLDATQDYQILLFGGGKKENEQIDALAKDYPTAIAVAGKISFPEEVGLIAHLDAMLAMDSGNGHIAAMFGVPVLTIWGATHPFAGFAPFDQPEANQFLPDREKYPLLPTSVYGKKEVAGYEDAMRSITPESILRRLQQIKEK